MEKQYEKYLTTWLAGIKDEIHFWDSFIRTKGKICTTTKRWLQTISNESPFVLDEDLEEKKVTKFLDVGSGPFSRCGFITNKTKLDFIAVDPLASIYASIKDKYNINTKIKPVTAMVENLSSKFGENEFDIVHMSNSLDHCFDPILGLWQMLYVVKVGGKIILRHHENEAELEKYNGFHQWNLAIQNGRFVIWRNDIKYDVAEIFENFAEIIEIQKDVIEKGGTWHYDKVVIRKIKNVPLHFNENYPLLIEKILEEICMLNYKFLFPPDTHKTIHFLGFKIKYKPKK